MQQQHPWRAGSRSLREAEAVGEAGAGGGSRQSPPASAARSLGCSGVQGFVPSPAGLCSSQRPSSPVPEGGNPPGPSSSLATPRRPGEPICESGKFGESLQGEVFNIWGKREMRLSEGKRSIVKEHEAAVLLSGANGIQQNLICSEEIHFHFIGQTKSCYAQETSVCCVPNSNNSVQSCRQGKKKK